MVRGAKAEAEMLTGGHEFVKFIEDEENQDGSGNPADKAQMRGGGGGSYRKYISAHCDEPELRHEGSNRVNFKACHVTWQHSQAQPGWQDSDELHELKRDGARATVASALVCQPATSCSFDVARLTLPSGGKLRKLPGPDDHLPSIQRLQWVDPALEHAAARVASFDRHGAQENLADRVLAAWKRHHQGTRDQRAWQINQ